MGSVFNGELLLEVKVSCISVHIHHELTLIEQIGKLVEVILALDCFEWVLSCSQGKNPNLLLIVEKCGNLVSIQGWVVADDTTIDLKLLKSISIDLVLGVEEGWGGR